MTKDVSDYKLTTYSCFAGIFVQAVVTNITPILFIPFMRLYGFNYAQLGFLVTVNFFAQLLVDIVFSKAIDHYGFKKMVLPATFIAACGLILFGLVPYLFNNIFIGVLLATVIFSMAAGCLEITLSPIIDAIPNKHKGPAMAIMHSFYAWGQIATILLTTLLLLIFGVENWNYILIIWAVVPASAFIMFSLSLFPPVVHESKRIKIRSMLKNKYYIVALLAILFGGATEVNMNQWASSFMEKALLFNKSTGDLIGMAGFALMLGIGRLLYGRFGHKADMGKILIISSAMAVVCYLTVVFSGYVQLSVVALAACGLFSSLLWPGTLVITADKFPMSGSWLFAILAAAGDIGAGVGPLFTGAAADYALKPGAFIARIFPVTMPVEQIALRAGLFAAVIFPLGALACHLYLSYNTKRAKRLNHL